MTQINEQQYLGTVIVLEAMERLKATLNTQYIRVIDTPRPAEAYTTLVGERVILFRSAFEPIPEEELVILSMN